MAKTEEKTVAKLREIIDSEGPAYLENEPYLVYKELVDSRAADRKMAGAVLHALVSGSLNDAKNNCSVQELSESVQKECCFIKSMADKIAQIFLLLYSPDNKTAWEEKDKEGLRQFLGDEFTFTWKGFSVWDAGNGTVDCHYKAEIVLMPTESIREDKELTQLLDEKPFTAKDEINMHFEKELREYLDNKFEEYCTEDDYYQPVVEDFDIDYQVSEWSKENGFEVVSCDGNGENSGYEPKFRSRW